MNKIVTLIISVFMLCAVYAGPKIPDTLTQSKAFAQAAKMYSVEKMSATSTSSIPVLKIVKVDQVVCMKWSTSGYKLQYSSTLSATNVWTTLEGSESKTNACFLMGNDTYWFRLVK
jgi:ABC-type uncharacterized transport system permease subunit